ncbi:hypothetical protein CHUAL_000800 [Chamberlinius hualienensis]
METAVLVTNIAIIPAICVIGVIGNVVNLIVLLQPEMKRSQYVYLSVMSFMDVITLILEMISSLGQGYSQGGRIWAFYDAHVHLPFGCMTSSISVLTMVVYTFERYIYARRPIASRRWCHQSVAKKVSTFVIIFCVLFNTPYFFAFEVNDDNQMTYSDFAKSNFYVVLNWIRLFIFGVLSFAIMLFVNGIIFSTLFRAHRLRQVLFTKAYIRQEYRLQNRTRVIRVLAAAVILFTVGELPTHFISRTSIYSLILKFLNGYGYEYEFSFQQILYRLIRTISCALMCSHYAVQFICYISFDILYGRVFRKIFYKKCICSQMAGNRTNPSSSIHIISSPS